MQVVNIPTQNLQPGPSQVIGQWPIPEGVTAIELRFPRNAWPVTGSLLAEYSLEYLSPGGYWTYWGGSGLMGGDEVDPKTGTTDFRSRHSGLPAPCELRMNLTVFTAFQAKGGTATLLP